MDGPRPKDTTNHIYVSISMGWAKGSWVFPMSPRSIAVLLAMVIVMSPLWLLVITSQPSQAAPVLIEEFVGGVTNATFEFYDRLYDDSLAIELPRGSSITRAELVLEGVPGEIPEHRSLDFSNGTMHKHLWARDRQGFGLHPPSVNPYNNAWDPATAQDLQSLASVDNVRWDTNTTHMGGPPYAWPVQLYHFNPRVPGAVSIDVCWYGMGYAMANRTTNFHAELWLFDHDLYGWRKVEEYTGGRPVLRWLNHTIATPSPYFSSNGSVDVAVVGMHSDEMDVGPATFESVGCLFTDYIVINGTTVGGLQYPQDITLTIGKHSTATVEGPLTEELTLGDGHGLRAALQAAIDEETVMPGDLTLAFNISLGSITMGRLKVGG